VIMRAVPFWRTYGMEAWIRAEEARYRCHDCGGATYRGAQRCPHCRTRVSHD
jgi:Zn finger protein HypA/HybF involved in hydrogenase expression